MTRPNPLKTKILDPLLTQPNPWVNPAHGQLCIIILLYYSNYDRCSGDGDPVYGACSPSRCLIILCGVDEHGLERTTSSGRKISYHFPEHMSWQRLPHDVNQSVLAMKLQRLMLSDPPVGVKLLQTTARCEVFIFFFIHQTNVAAQRKRTRKLCYHKGDRAMRLCIS